MVWTILLDCRSHAHPPGTGLLGYVNHFLKKNHQANLVDLAVISADHTGSGQAWDGKTINYGLTPGTHHLPRIFPAPAFQRI